MVLDVEVVKSDVDYEGMLLLLAIWRLGLAKSSVDAITLMANGAVLLNGQAVTDLNARLPKTATLVVGLHGVQLG
jgi:hypothetical protein